MRRRRSLLEEETLEENFWPAFTDVVSTIALILFVLVLLAYLQNLLSGKKMLHIQAELDVTARQLGDSQAKISRSEKELRLLEQKLNVTMAEIKKGETHLRLSEQRVEEQNTIIAESNRELGDLRSQLRGIAVLRVDVIKKVKQAIENELGGTTVNRQPEIAISDNGNIIINENLVFEYNSYEIKPEAKPLLDTLSNAFSTILSDDTVSENVDVILIQGHTDERGSTSFNRDLSAKRANAVLDYMFSAAPKLESRFGRYFASSAYSKFRPVNEGKNEKAYMQNRRIEISVVLKDSSVQKVIDQYFANPSQAAATSDPASSFR
ncbi:MAG: OmpA family protein [Deltaproteobacteria bacterium]|nr:OmpA family protein [Deltaproteobacteria bacterium]